MALILTLALIGCVTFGNAERARADILGASLFTAIPVSWPVVATVLIACGVGTAVYYATLPPEKKDEIVTQVVNILSARRLTLITEAIYKGYQKQYAQGSGQYVKGVVGTDGKSYLSKDIVDAILDAADGLGMLAEQELVVDRFNGSVNPIDGMKVLDTLRMPPQAMVSWFEFPSGGSMSAFRNLTLTLSAYDIICTDRYYDGTLEVGVILASEIEGVYWGENKFLKNESNENQNVPIHRYLCKGNGEYTQSGITQPNTVINNLQGYSFGAEKDSPIRNKYTNFGSYDVSQSGTPVGELGRAIEQDGAWDLPGGVRDIDNYGEATPISTSPDVTGSDVVTSSWDGSVPFPQSITLPDVIAVPEGITVPATQTEAIEGDAEDTEPIAVPSPITPEYEAFLVPDWIKRRFPFCIPFDISNAIKGMNNNKNLIIDFTVEISGCPVHVYQDFSEFEDMFAAVRSGMFIMYGIFLFFVTKDMIKW